MMNRRTELNFLVTAVIGLIAVVALATIWPVAGDYVETTAAEPNYRTAGAAQQTDPAALLVPESTLPETSQRYVPNWDDNPVATIPESTMGQKPQRYIHNWDDNPVATIPESTMGQKPQRYQHNWDDNPVLEQIRSSSHPQ